jgi:uncharacterized protein (DUF2345 family)
VNAANKGDVQVQARANDLDLAHSIKSEKFSKVVDVMEPTRGLG